VGQGSTFTLTLPVFSLRKLIAPLLTDQERAPASLALITVTLPRPLQGTTDESWHEVTRELRGVIQRCLLPDLDFLLPPMMHSEVNETCFVVARANQKGIDVLCKRLRQQLARHDSLSGTDLVCTLGAAVVDNEPGAVGAEALDVAVSKLEGILCNIMGGC
jgi:hypothetical protein